MRALARSDLFQCLSAVFLLALAVDSLVRGYSFWMLLAAMVAGLLVVFRVAVYVVHLVRDELEL